MKLKTNYTGFNKFRCSDKFSKRTKPTKQVKTTIILNNAC